MILLLVSSSSVGNRRPDQKGLRRITIFRSFRLLDVLETEDLIRRDCDCLAANLGSAASAALETEDLIRRDCDIKISIFDCVILQVLETEDLIRRDCDPLTAA